MKRRYPDLETVEDRVKKTEHKNEREYFESLFLIGRELWHAVSGMLQRTVLLDRIDSDTFHAERLRRLGEEFFDEHSDECLRHIEKYHHHAKQVEEEYRREDERERGYKEMVDFKVFEEWGYPISEIFKGMHSIEEVKERAKPGMAEQYMKDGNSWLRRRVPSRCMDVLIPTNAGWCFGAVFPDENSKDGHHAMTETGLWVELQYKQFGTADKVWCAMGFRKVGDDGR
jgi:hypothetical protein